MGRKQDKEKDNESKAASGKQRPAGSDAGGSDTAESRKIAELKAAVSDLTDTCQRLQAEFENYKKRAEREARQAGEYALLQFLKKMLPVVDSFEEARKVKDDPGIALLHKQFLSVLEAEGVKPIPAAGKVDTSLHEVLLTQPSDKEEGTILQVLQQGYEVNGKVIRHTKVAVAKAALGNKDNPQEGAGQ